MGKERLSAITKEIETKDDPGYAGTRGRNIFTVDYETWTPKEAENSINILEPNDDNRYFGMKIFVHYRVGGGGDHFLCPKANSGGRCPVCEHQANLISNLPPNNEGYTDEIKKLFPTARMVYMIVDTMNEKEIEKGVQIYCAAYDQVDRKGIVPLCQPRRGEGGPIDVSDPSLALDVVFTREGKDKNTRYFGFSTADSRINAEEFLEDIPETFEDILDFADYDTINEAFNTSDNEENEESEEPKKRKTRGLRTSDNEENEESEEPKKRKTRGLRTSDNEESEEPKEKQEEEEQKEEVVKGESKAEIRKRLREKIKSGAKK